MTTTILTGTCGFAYRAWAGAFYPTNVSASTMLSLYARTFRTVEIDSTFYRPPDPGVLARWHRATPTGFLFSLKVPREITHERRLSDIARPLRSFYMAMAELEEKAGPALFQLPPNLRKDLSLLRGLLSLVPHGGRTAVEFRHPSWRDDDVMEALREAGATLCIVDALRGDTPLVATARFGYLRLRRPMYSRRALAEWIERIRAQPWSEVFVYFKHAGAARAPALAHTMAQMLGTRPSDGATEIDAPSAEP